MWAVSAYTCTPCSLNDSVMQSSFKLSGISRTFLVLAALLMATNLFLPVWRIELYAPQYPEGLALQIHADGLRGDVEIINGLNHYIGMKTLHSEQFIEFSILRYLFGALSLLFVAAAVFGTRRWLYAAFGTLVVFGMVALADFYRWNYNYGHDLDPNAAIKVPGMAYQPPVLGFKQLLNFGAYSIPDLGGWCMVAAGLLLLTAVVYEGGWLRRFGIGRTAAGLLILGIPFVIPACGQPQPRPLALHEDMCAFCKMNIADARFAAQLVTAKGRKYVYDDLSCLRDYLGEQPEVDAAPYVADFSDPGRWIPVGEAVLLESESFQSPMGGNTAAFARADSAALYEQRFEAKRIAWE